jgi:hypothetical protein
MVRKWVPFQEVFSPDSIAGLQVWLEADALSLADTDPVATWTDSSGNGHDFTAAGGVRPIYRTGILNGLPVVRFATDDEMTSDLTGVFASAATLFVVYTVSGDTDYSIYETTTTGDGFWRWSGDGNGYARTFRSARIATYPLATATTGTRVASVVSSGSTFQVYFDGVGQGAQAAAFSGGTTHVLGSAGGKEFLEGDIAEVIAYDSALSDSDRQAVEAYLADKWGL